MAAQARYNALVALLTPSAYLLLQNLLIAFSNFPKIGP